MELTHWKKLHNPDYLGAYALQPGEEPILTIKKIVRDKVPDTNGNKEECTVMYFVEQKKPMVLNVTNSKTIEKMLGTPYIEEWVGKQIQLYVDKVKAFGEVVDALRVRSKAPRQQKDVLTPSNPKWDSALKCLANKETTIAAIQKRFTIPVEFMQALEEAANA